jgi:hypothetical protein
MVVSTFKGKQKHYVLTFITTFNTIMIRNIVFGSIVSTKKPLAYRTNSICKRTYKIEIKHLEVII